MRIYFRRFRNVTPDHYRRVFQALPDEKIDAPGDFAKPFYEMRPIRQELRGWVERLVVRIDIGRCREAALRWLPEGDYPTPEMFLVYDNNAGSYTARGKAFYKLYSGENPRTTSVDEMEAVIEDLVARHASQRPDLLHALGWWMVSRISGEGRDETAVRELVTIFVAGFAAPLAIPLVTSSDLPTGWKTAIAGGLAVGVPEIMMVLAAPATVSAWRCSRCRCCWDGSLPTSRTTCRATTPVN